MTDVSIVVIPFEYTYRLLLEYDIFICRNISHNTISTDYIIQWFCCIHKALCWPLRSEKNEKRLMVTLAKNETNNPYNVRYFFVCARSSCLLLRIEELLAKKYIYYARIWTCVASIRFAKWETTKVRKTLKGWYVTSWKSYDVLESYSRKWLI